MAKNDKVIFSNSLSAKRVEKEKLKISAVEALKNLMKSPAALKSNRVKNPILRLHKKLLSGNINENDSIIAVLEHYDYHGRTLMTGSDRVGGDSARKVAAPIVKNDV